MNELMVTLIEQLAEEGIDVTIYRKRGRVCADINTHTKSGIYLFSEEDAVVAHGRYGEQETVESIDDLMWIFERRYHNCGRGSREWLDLAERRDILKKKMQTIVTYQ